MTNKIESALKAAIEALSSCSKNTFWNGGYEQSFNQYSVGIALEQCKAALADIEKCEPVGELILDPVFLPALKAPLVNWKINLVDLEVGTKFYTSPQPRDWVGLSDLDISDAYYKAMNQELRPTDKVGVYKVAKALEAKCKQLNTKG